MENDSLRGHYITNCKVQGEIFYKHTLYEYLDIHVKIKSRTVSRIIEGLTLVVRLLSVKF